MIRLVFVTDMRNIILILGIFGKRSTLHYYAFEDVKRFFNRKKQIDWKNHICMTGNICGESARLYIEESELESILAIPIESSSNNDKKSDLTLGGKRQRKAPASQIF